MPGLQNIAVTMCVTIFALTSQTALAADETIKSAQTILVAMGYDVGKPDGVAGKRTVKAIEDVMVRYGQTYDGTISENELILLERVAPAAVEVEFDVEVSEIYLMDAADMNGDGRDDFVVAAMADPEAQLGIPCCEVPADRLSEIESAVPQLIYSTPSGYAVEPFPDETKGLRTWAGRFFSSDSGSFFVLGRNGEMGLPGENHGERSIIVEFDTNADEVSISTVAEFPEAGVTASVEILDLDADGNPEMLVNNYGDVSSDSGGSFIMELEPDGSLQSVGKRLGLEPNKAHNFLTAMDIDGNGKPDLFAAGEIQKSFDGKAIYSKRPGSYVMFDPFDGKSKRIYLNPPHWAENHSGLSVMPLTIGDRTFVFEAAVEFLGHQGGGFVDYNLDVFELDVTKKKVRQITEEVLPKSFAERPSSMGAWLRRVDVDFDGTDEIYAQQYVDRPQFLRWDGTAFDLLEFPTENYFQSSWSARLIVLSDAELKCVRAATATNMEGKGETGTIVRVSECIIFGKN